MKIVLQRVTHASVTADGRITGEIGSGMLLLAGFGKADEAWLSEESADDVFARAAAKIANLRIYSNEAGKLDYSLKDIDGDILLVPQFTLYGKSKKGRRPDFTDALPPAHANAAFDQLHCALGHETGKPIPAGVFGADMAVSLVNDGPFTLELAFP